MAVDPGKQYLGLAVLEGEELIWYAVKTFPPRMQLPEIRIQLQRILTAVLERFRPTVLAVEEPFYAPSLQSLDLKRLTELVKTWGRWKRLTVRSYYSPAVKAFFCRDCRNKHSVAEAMIGRYPYLVRYLSPLPWRRRYWFHVFDAVALGLMCHQKLSR